MIANSKPLIGIAASAQSGKSTVARYLRDRFGYGEVSFAEPIRQFISSLTGIPRADLEAGPLKEAVIPWIGKSPRQMMQTLGTEWGRNLVKESFWVDRAMQTVNDLAWSFTPAVISDVRFENEAEAIRERGGFILHLSRPNALQVASHPSEAGVKFMPYADARIVNDSTLSVLYAEVRDMLGRKGAL
jgi:hypothetical protein